MEEVTAIIVTRVIADTPAKRGRLVAVPGGIARGRAATRAARCNA
ncbi:hypothetical protein [Rathayibacter sp. PhB152]|nr:hypothetical protein [Rathayibacter sp. PhB152]